MDIYTSMCIAPLNYISVPICKRNALSEHVPYESVVFSILVVRILEAIRALLFVLSTRPSSLTSMKSTSQVAHCVQFCSLKRYQFIFHMTCLTLFKNTYKQRKHYCQYHRRNSHELLRNLTERYGFSYLILRKTFLVHHAACMYRFILYISYITVYIRNSIS